MFWFVDSDLKLDKPQATLRVDRDLIGRHGLTERTSAPPWARPWRRLRQLLLARRPFIQGHSPGPAEIPLEPGAGARLLHPCGDGSVVPAGTVARIDTSTVPEAIQPFSAVEFGGPSRVRPEFPRPMH